MGARPNYTKVAPLFDPMRRAMPSVAQMLVDTGQHYDDAFAGAFVRILALPASHRNLDVGSGSRHTHITKVAAAFEQVCRDKRPDVVGDVTSTLGAATGAVRVGIPHPGETHDRVAHRADGRQSGRCFGDIGNPCWQPDCARRCLGNFVTRSLGRTNRRTDRRRSPPVAADMKKVVL